MVIVRWPAPAEPLRDPAGRDGERQPGRPEPPQPPEPASGERDELALVRWIMKHEKSLF